MAHDNRRAPATLVSYALLVVTMTLWAGNFVVGRGIRADVPPIALTFWRWVVAGLVLLPWVWSDLRGARQRIFAHWRLLSALSLTGVVAYNCLLYTGLRETTAIHASLMLAMTPIVIGLASQVFLWQSGGVLQWVGTLTSLLGALVIVSRGTLSSLAGMTLNRGDVWILAAVLSWAAFTVLLARVPAALSPFLTQFVIVCLGVVVLTPIYVWELSQGRSIVVGAASLQAIAYLGIFASVVAYVLWYRAIGDVGPVRAGLFLYLIPVFSAVLSAVFLGEPVYLYHLGGACFIFTGLVVASRSNRQRSKPRPEAEQPASRGELRRGSTRS